MLSREENELLTRTGPGTPMGALMRRYWIPALFSTALLEPDCAPVRVKLLGERLVAFRDTKGRVGLLDERCPHRTASLFFGRNEECGLRCVYHGWKFDIDGNCVDQPSEPAGSSFKDKVKQTAYPCVERGGLVWTYMGPKLLKPDFPALEWTEVPESHRYVTRHLQECNWLQALEGGFDSAHLNFLHRGTANVLHNRPFPVPTRQEVVPADFGLISISGRDTPDGITGAANVMLMPFHKLISVAPLGAHAWVPVDDETTMNYSIEYWADHPLTEEELSVSRSGEFIHPELIPGTDRKVQNRDNEYLIDRALQKSGHYTGIRGLGTQDCGIQESMGPIADRTVEHLGVGDIVVAKIRRLLLQTLADFERGATPPGMNAESYRVRSGFFKLPKGAKLLDAIDKVVKVPAAAPAFAK
ncbi:MAG TPA: Rieske 2Fe-2S domain-containing protein [Stellaceae bacterium]|nr:Rieske 2Fe-2S domain-containing protein [Stellaceae bacterium]